jgi:hypothetical protein
MLQEALTGDADDDPQAPKVAAAAEDAAPRDRVGALAPDGRLDFGHLELDERVSSVVVTGVVPSEDVARLLDLPLGNEPVDDERESAFGPGSAKDSLGKDRRTNEGSQARTRSAAQRQRRKRKRQ